MMKNPLQHLNHRWQLLTSQMPKPIEILIVAIISTAVHAAVFLLLQPVIGYVIASFILLPVLAVAWLYGTKYGVYASIVAFFANIILITIAAQSFALGLYIEGLTGHFFTLITAIIVGRFSALSQKLKIELQGRRKIEQTLQESEELYRLLSENLNDMVCLHQSDGRLTYLSSSVKELLGYTANELLGKRPFRLFHPDTLEIFNSHDFLDPVHQEEDFTVEAQIRHKDGHYIWVESRMRPFTYTNDNQIHWQSITRNTTVLKAREAALRLAKEEAEKANQVKSEFLANMSHEIRTPMNAVIGLTELLMESPLNLEQLDFLGTIRASSDGLLGIINDILDFSKIEAGKLELENSPFNLRDCVEDALDLNAAKAADKGLELAYLIDDQVPTLLLGDVTRLRQILVNLLSNAVKFTSSGEIFLSVTQLTAKDKSHELRFSVLDTGIGIPPERMSRLFQSFSQVDASTTRQYGGTGLGLVISKRLAEAMGGEMWVESEANKGSTFSFTIVADALGCEGDNVVETAVSPRTLNGKRILVVDDNDVNRLILKHYLYRWQVESHLVASGEEALNLLAQGQTFDLAILDMQMPTMDGVMLAEAIKALPALRPFPLVLLSSIGLLTNRDASTLFTNHIAKPVKPNSLFRALEQALNIENSMADVAKTAIPSLDETPLQSLHVLLAEDNSVNQKVALRMLKRLGYRASVAANGYEVLAALQQRPYDVILMDVQMPEMDGIVATRHIRQNNELPQQPHIIALTANALKGDRERFLAAGMDDYLSKPVRLEELAEALARCPLAPVPA